MRHLLIAGLLFISACSLLPSATTVVEPPIDSVPSDTSGTDATPSTTQPAETSPDDATPGWLDTTDRRVAINRTGAEPVNLTGDVDYALANAFSDLVGGLIFQYDAPGSDVSAGLLRLAAGTIEPVELITSEDNENLTLVDVSTIEGRTNVVYISRTGGRTVGGQLLAADPAGGAPVLLYEGPDLVSGAVSEDLIAVELRVNANCNKLVVFADGSSLFEVDCVGQVGPNSVAVFGDLIATVEDSTVHVFDRTGAEVDTFGSLSGVEVLDLDADEIVVRTGPSGYLVASAASQLRFVANDPINAVTLFSDPVMYSAGHRLGGVPPLDGPCSAVGQIPVPVAQTELPDLASATRNAIVDRATTCDIDGLAALTATNFAITSSFDTPRRAWLASESRFGDDLSLIVRILNMPSTTETLATGELLYIWPSAASPNATEADWEAVLTVFNEEEVDVMRDAGGYSGLRVGITAGGQWILAQAGE